MSSSLFKNLFVFRCRQKNSAAQDSEIRRALFCHHIWCGLQFFREEVTYALVERFTLYARPMQNIALNIGLGLLVAPAPA